MTTLLLLFFYLIQPSSTRPMCALWVSDPVTLNDLAAACPEGIQLENYQADWIELESGQVVCTANATGIFYPFDACDLTRPLDQYRIQIYQELTDAVLCSVESYNATPTRDEIAAACSWEALTAYDENRAELRYMGEVQPDPVTPPVEIQAPLPGPGLYDQPTSAAELATTTELTWLAGRLIWHNRVQPVCGDGLSGLDPQTLAADPCGSAAAAPLTDTWQNQFDAEIYAAALAEGVPARLLKQILRTESQFWPLWDERPAGEVGLAQITAAGADQYLRWYAPAYGRASHETQQQLQAELMNSLRCHGCNLEQATAKERENILIYARLLRAYRLSADDWYGALILWNGEPYAQKVSHG